MRAFDFLQIALNILFIWWLNRLTPKGRQTMKGYHRRWGDLFKPVTEECAVQCRRCRNTWKEQVTHYNVFAGYAHHYDYCDKCITPDDNGYVAQHVTEKDGKNGPV